MSIESIYKSLLYAGLSRAGACGIMGNMQAESAMQANIAQRGMTELTDAEYTRRADSGRLDFVRDAVGYGLCQWTYWSRKQALLDFARARGASVGDEGIQVEFCIHELRRDYPALFATLCESGSVYDCAARVCREYERPAVNNIGVRAAYAQGFYNWFDSGAAKQENTGGGNVANPGNPENAGAANPSGTEAVPGEACWPPRMLCEGMRGADAACAQALMAARGYACATSGDFDAPTARSTRAFQAAHGLAVDGVIGAKTWAALLSVRV